MKLTADDIVYIDDELIPYIAETFGAFSREFPGTLLFAPAKGCEACYCTLGWEQKEGEELVIPIQVERFSDETKGTWSETSSDLLEIPFTLCHIIDEDGEKFKDVVAAIMRARRR